MSHSKPVLHIIALLSPLAADFIGYPVRRVSYVQQVEDLLARDNRLNSQIGNTATGLGYLVKSEGFLSLWKGWHWSALRVLVSYLEQQSTEIYHLRLLGSLIPLINFAAATDMRLARKESELQARVWIAAGKEAPLAIATEVTRAAVADDGIVFLMKYIKQYIPAALKYQSWIVNGWLFASVCVSMPLRVFVHRRLYRVTNQPVGELGWLPELKETWRNGSFFAGCFALTVSSLISTTLLPHFDTLVHEKLKL